MKSAFLVFACVSGLTLAAPPAWAAKCQDIPVRVTFYTNAVVDPATGATTPSALASDGGGEYFNASIKVCSGTNDAVTVNDSRRTFTYTFPSPLAGSVIQAMPSWVPGSRAVTGSINIRNILYNKGSDLPFATMAGSTFSAAGDRGTYRIGFKGWSPDVPNAPNLHDPQQTPGDNTPFPSSPVTVYPTYPRPCGPGNMPRWLVRATSPNAPGTAMQVGTLHKQGSGNSEIHEGQYSMPFEMLIEAMQCFAY